MGIAKQFQSAIFAAAVFLSNTVLSNSYSNPLSPRCHELIAQILQQAQTPQRQALVEFVKERGIPTFLEEDTEFGDLPIILLNKNTYNDLGFFLDNSFGLSVSLHPGETDHGYLRNRTMITDLFRPGMRPDAGEINDTGIAWKDLSEYLPRRSEKSRIMVDVAYALNRQERDVVDYYTRVRRAALFRSTYLFHEPHEKWLYSQMPHHVASSGEQCWHYPLGSCAREHVDGMRYVLSLMGYQDPDALFHEAPVQEFLGRARQLILSSEWRDPAQMNTEFLMNRAEFHELLAPYMNNKGLSHEQRIQFMSFLVGIDASRSFKFLYERMGIGEDAWDINSLMTRRHSRILAVFVYDDSPSAPEKFWQAKYRANGGDFKLKTKTNFKTLP